MPYFVGIADCTHVGSAMQKNTTNQIADVLVEDLLQLLLDLITVSQERELHKTNRRNSVGHLFRLFDEDSCIELIGGSVLGIHINLARSI